MAKRVRIFGPGLNDLGKTLPLPDVATSATVAAFLDLGVHELTDKHGNVFFWHGGAGCPFLFVLEEYDPNKRPVRVF